MNEIRRPLKKSLLWGILLFVFVLCIVLIGAQYFTIRRSLYSQYENRIENILNYAENCIDTDDLAECIRTGNESEKFKETQHSLDKIKEHTAVHYLYIIIPLNTAKTDNIRNVMAAATQYEYESVYGAKIWNTSLDGVTLEDNVKETVLEKVAQMKSMALLAKKKNVELDETEKSFASAAAKDYMGHISVAQRESLGITEETVQKLFEEYALAHKVYQKVIEDVNPEISDDEARIVTVQQIVIRTTSRDAQGNDIDIYIDDPNIDRE